MNRKKTLVAANLAMWVAQGLYTVSPIDLVPDILPLLGWMDDGLGLLVTIGFTVYTISVLRKYGVQGLTATTDPSHDAEGALGPDRIDRAYAGGSSALDGYEPLSLDDLEAL